MSHLRGQQTQDAILQLGADILGAIARIDRTVPASAPVALSQLPAALRGFTGREADMEVLGGLLDPAEPAGAVVSAVAGLAGVGKTTLAVQAGTPPGREAGIRAGCCSSTCTAMTISRSSRRRPWTRCCAPWACRPSIRLAPTSAPDCTGPRWLEVARPVLVIADSTSSEAQVRPLLPGAGPHAVVVTSRHTLAGLGAPD